MSPWAAEIDVQSYENDILFIQADANKPAKYSLVVSFEAINQDIEIYEKIRNLIEVEIDNLEQEIEVENVDR